VPDDDRPPQELQAWDGITA
jgi:hypothetical protein